MPPKKQYSGSIDYYERKLKTVMVRLGIPEKDFNWNYDRHGGHVEFRYRGELYRFEHSIEKAKAINLKLTYGSDAFAQIVLSLEDLARMVERGIYDLQTWVAGMKFLPPVQEIPSFFKVLRFDRIPAGVDDVHERYRQLAKTMHPDNSGSAADFKLLQDATEQAKKYFGGGHP
jgi:hypothetical protein